MAKKTQGSFRVPGGFEVQNPYPVDDRMTVAFDSDLTLDSNAPGTLKTKDLYEGMIVYSEESEQHYRWNGLDRTNIDNWIVIGGQNITEKVITVTLGDIGATDFDDNIPQKIKDYAIAEGIEKLPNQVHKWDLIEDIYGLKVPTADEWTNEIDSFPSNDAEGAFNSVLKLPKAPLRFKNDGDIPVDGDEGFYYSRTISSVNQEPRRVYIRDDFVKFVTITPSGGDPAFGKALRLIIDGTFTQQQFEENYEGITITIRGLQYGFVYNPTTQKIWLDRNLGASRVATSLDDLNSFGYLFQWGRPADGHEKRDSLTYDGDANGKPSSVGESGAWDGKFITTSLPNSSWLETNDNTLWQDFYITLPTSNKKQIYIINQQPEGSYSNVDIEDFVLVENEIDGGWSENAIPLTGTETDKKVTGNIDAEESFEEDYGDFSFVQKKYTDETFNPILKEQEVVIGGVYNDYLLSGNVLILTNEDAKVIFTGFNTDKYKLIYLINNSGFELQLNSEDSNSVAEHQIKLPDGIVNVGLQGTSVLKYIETNSLNKWQIINTFGARYMPEHKGLDEDAVVVVGEDSVSKTKQTVNLFEVNQAITDTTLADGTDNTTNGTGYDTLNDLYPNTIVGFEVICENAGTDGVVYKLMNDTSRIWKKLIYSS